MRQALRAILFLSLFAAPAFAGDIPPCALSGSPSVIIAGKPALRLGDVAACPAELIEPIPGISIDGQPMVHIRTGTADETDCAATGEPGVIVDREPAQGLGHVRCTKK